MLRLLVALDFSDCSRLALATALTVAERAGETELVVLSVLERSSAANAEALDEVEAKVSALHAMVQEECARRGSPALPGGVRAHYHVVRGAPADEIIAQAAAHRADAVVMGTHGRTGLDRLLTGSVAERVVRGAPCSVLTVKPKLTAAPA